MLKISVRVSLFTKTYHQGVRGCILGGRSHFESIKTTNVLHKHVNFYCFYIEMIKVRAKAVSASLSTAMGKYFLEINDWMHPLL